jgi:hypothetical protein
MLRGTAAVHVGSARFSHSKKPYVLRGVLERHTQCHHAPNVFLPPNRNRRILEPNRSATSCSWSRNWVSVSNGWDSLILQLVVRTAEYKIGYYIENPWCTYFIQEIPHKILWGIPYINIRNLRIGTWSPVYIIKLVHIVENRPDDYSYNQLVVRCAPGVRQDAMVRVPQTGFGLRDDTRDECVSHPG